MSARSLSALRDQRALAARLLGERGRPLETDLLDRLRGALHLGLVIAYAQGVTQLRSASEVYGFGLDLAEIARIWQGGCIIRAALLERFEAIHRAQPDLTNPLLDAGASRMVRGLLPDLRATVGDAVALGIPAPGLMMALAYLDGLRSPRLPANLIQAQRDYFGAHGFRRVDGGGIFHAPWQESDAG